MKTIVYLSFVVLMVPMLAFGGAKERKQKKKEVQKIEKFSTTIKNACGCSVPIEVSWKSYKKAKQMRYIGRQAEVAAKWLAKFCKDDEENKEVFCKHQPKKLTKIRISYAPKGKGELASNYLTAHSGAGFYSGHYVLKKNVEDWD